jgi:predicted nuclease with TOPRIM domain
MVNPSDHGIKVEKTPEPITVIKEVEKIVDRPVYVVSEEMYQTLVSIEKKLNSIDDRLGRLEARNDSLENRYTSLRDEMCAFSKESSRSNENHKLVETQLDARIERLSNKLDQFMARPEPTLGRLIKKVWAG